MTQRKLRNPSVLVVDDEGLIRWALSQGLAESGCAVQEASSGEETRALLAAGAARPDVVLLDLRLPDVSDLTLLREIRENWPEIPIVIMTAHGSATDAEEAVRLGAYRFVSKPFDVAEMVRLVRDAWASLDGR
jgi:DNA-binding NtrC family response regulator